MAPVAQSDIERIVAALPRIPERGAEFRYASVPLCILDAVFSIGARYESVQALVERYTRRYDLPLHRPSAVLPDPLNQAEVSVLVGQIEAIGPERFAVEVLHNRRPTSPRNGILRSEAARRFGVALETHGVQTFQDLTGGAQDPALDRDLRAVHGQGSGIAVKYFFMLAGADHLVKPDRMIMRFLRRVLDRPVSAEEAQQLLGEVADVLSIKGKAVTTGAVDYAIWSHEREMG